MFSKDRSNRKRGKHSNYQSPAFDEANLQPLDFSGRDDKEAAPVLIPTLGADGAVKAESGTAPQDEAFAAATKAESEPVPAPAPAPAELEDFQEHRGAHSKQAAVAAVAAEEAVEDEPELAAEENAADGEPTDTAAVEPIADDAVGAAAAAESEDAAAAEAVQEAEARPTFEAASASTLVDGEETAAAYSRDNASYEHRRGWAAMEAWQKRVLIIVIVLLALLSAAAGVAIALWQNTNEEVQIQDNELTESLTAVEDENIDPYWVLILGSDSRNQKTDRARSDVIMMARIDPNTPRVTLVSIPRDTKVNIKGYGTNKINAAYALGGASLAVKTVESYAGIKISHYVEIYFSGLEDLVDKLGGVTVNVPEYCKYSDVELKPGKQTLTGHEALIFARCRKTYSQGDFTRTQCQRILVSALVKKALAQDATSLPSVVTSAAKCFKTDMSLQDLIALAQRMQGLTSKNIYSGMAPSTTGMVDGVSYTFTYINQWKLIMQKAKKGQKPTLTDEEKTICGSIATNTQDMDVSESLPSDVKSQLKSYWAEQEEKKAAAAAKKLKKQQEQQAAQSGEQSQEGETAQADEGQQAA